MPVFTALGKLRAVINDDAYAGTFQSLGQYRSSLLKHVDNLAAAAQLAARKPQLESFMNAPYQMPLVASMYPSEHPFPLAVRRVSQLERAMQSGVIVQLDALATYTVSPNGGMRQDPMGPWVLKLDVMGQARTADTDGHALAIFASKMHDRLTKARKNGRNGWDRPSECSVASLAALLVDNVATGDFVSVANYAMMLEQRGADERVLPAALQLHSEAQIHPVPFCRDGAENFAQALIAQGWHNPNPACVDGVQDLLAAFLTTHAADASDCVEDELEADLLAVAAYSLQEAKRARQEAAS